MSKKQPNGVSKKFRLVGGIPNLNEDGTLDWPTDKKFEYKSNDEFEISIPLVDNERVEER